MEEVRRWTAEGEKGTKGGGGRGGGRSGEGELEENEAEKWMEDENKKSFLFHRAMKPA